MKNLLKYYGLSDDSIKIYLEGIGKFPLTLSEIQKFVPKLSIDEVKEILDELINKKLVLVMKSIFFDNFPHYLFLPPIAAVINAFSQLDDTHSDITPQAKGDNTTIEIFQDNLLHDIELISQDLIEIMSTQSESNQTTEILSEVEKNVKNFSQVLLTEVNELIAKLKTRSIVNEIDIERVMRAVSQKIEESEEIISNMFIQFREIIDGMDSTNTTAQIESFKTFIRKLGESIENRSNEIVQKSGSLSSKDLQMVEKSLFNILADYISKDQISVDKVLPLYNLEKIKDVIIFLLENCKEKLTIIVPTLENFIPLEEFNLEYSEDKDSEPTIREKSLTLKKPNIPPKSNITASKKQKTDFLEKIDFTAKRVSDLKGYELSHNVADILAIVSEINPESLIIDNVQRWLNRLLVIRKYLDQNTQYLILEDIEKWKKDYLKIKKREVEPVQTQAESPESGVYNGNSLETSMSYKGLNLKIISSESHDNKHVKALKKKFIEYLRFKNNDIVAIIGDDLYLAFGICQKLKEDSNYEITGFTTIYKQFIDLIKPSILKIINEAKPTREIQINKGFNEIIENINDYTGKKISKKLKDLLNVAFEKDGISLNILEFKLFVNKLEKYLYPLDNDMKTYVIEELNKLNNEFSSLELIYPPEFRQPIIEEKTTEPLEQEALLEEREVEPFDVEKVNNLFDLFLEKIGDLKGVELGEQIDKFIEVVLKLQGYSQIVDWKKKLSNIKKELDNPLKEKIKRDFLNWKKGIINPAQFKEERKIEKSINTAANQKDYFSEVEEEYISPGLSQSQFQSEDVTPSTFIQDEIEQKTDLTVQMKEEFANIEKDFEELTGVDISKKMQNIVDIILESEGYSMDLKDIKDWISKLKRIKNPLEQEIKEDFVLSFFKWKEKYVKNDTDNYTLDFRTSLDSSETTLDEVSSQSGNNLGSKIETLMQIISNSTGKELSSELQDISDIVLRSHGAVAANVIRQWISKLRSIRDLLEDEFQKEFLEELVKWKEKFT
ncbi:MAG: hypothetical protein ACFFFT_16250 [Candidatus Thorarchaeota archaeon]